MGSILSVLGRADTLPISGMLILLAITAMVFRGRLAASTTRAVSLVVITTGFCGMIFELVVIFLFQCVYGYVFWWIGILVSFFMAGAALGAGAVVRMQGKSRDPLGFRFKLETGLMACFLGLAFVLSVEGIFLKILGATELAKAIFLVLSLVGGAMVGAEFPLGNALFVGKGRTPSEARGLLYGLDLLGGWLGGVMGGSLLLPILGAPGTSLAMGLSKIVSLAVSLSGFGYRVLHRGTGNSARITQ